MIELAEMVLRKTESRSKIVYQPLPADDPKQRKPDISEAHSRLDWSPHVPLEEGLDRTIHYFRQLLA
jgi:UDP-glucuronate decarboxylase